MLTDTEFPVLLNLALPRKPGLPLLLLGLQFRQWLDLRLRAPDLQKCPPVDMRTEFAPALPAPPVDWHTDLPLQSKSRLTLPVDCRRGTVDLHRGMPAGLLRTNPARARPVPVDWRKGTVGLHRGMPDGLLRTNPVRARPVPVDWRMGTVVLRKGMPAELVAE